ncbi:MAG: CoA transferase [bacterium]|nr:CoA transferase [bacterium]
MPYATLRCVHQGYRVIRLEPTPAASRRSKGDPNRYIGRPVAGEDRHSYFVAPNVGKEAITLDLKQEAGRELLHRLVRELPVDIFCTNTMPSRHERLGIDYETLRAERNELIWCCISAMGLDHPDVPGYDPVTQALCGYMDLTGHADGPPLQCGPPLIDLKAGDEAYTQIIQALWERSETGKGKCIDISMAQVAVSWLHTFLPMLDMGNTAEELRRSGNEHRQFIPVNAYRTLDGYVYLAIGSDVQWSRFVREPLFATLDQERFAGNEGRRSNKTELHASIEALTREQSSEAVAAALASAAVPHSRITPIEEVWELPFVRSKALRTVAPDGRTIRLPPPAVGTPHLEDLERCLPFAPAYSGDSRSIFAEVGLSAEEIAELENTGVAAAANGDTGE